VIRMETVPEGRILLAQRFEGQIAKKKKKTSKGVKSRSPRREMVSHGCAKQEANRACGYSWKMNLLGRGERLERSIKPCAKPPTKRTSAMRIKLQKKVTGRRKSRKEKVMNVSCKESPQKKTRTKNTQTPKKGDRRRETEKKLHMTRFGDRRGMVGEERRTQNFKGREVLDNTKSTEGRGTQYRSCG